MTSALTLDQAVDLTRSGDIWLFRGRRAPDRAGDTRWTPEALPSQDVAYLGGIDVAHSRGDDHQQQQQ